METMSFSITLTLLQEVTTWTHNFLNLKSKLERSFLSGIEDICKNRTNNFTFNHRQILNGKISTKYRPFYDWKIILLSIFILFKKHKLLLLM